MPSQPVRFYEGDLQADKKQFYSCCFIVVVSLFVVVLGGGGWRKGREKEKMICHFTLGLTNPLFEKTIFSPLPLYFHVK